MKDPHQQEAILYAFAIEPNHDRETLERYLRQYPELAEELIDLSSEFRLSEALGPSTASPEADAGWEGAWHEFLAAKTGKPRTVKAVNPFASFRGEAFVSLTQTLNVSRSFLTAFRDGLAVASTIPEGFARRFAEATNSSIESVREYFAHPQVALATREFKSDRKPSPQGQKTFEELVHSSDMTEQQRQVLLQDIQDDRLNRGKPTES